MLLSRPISAALCVSRCCRHMAHLQRRKACCYEHYVEEKTLLQQGVNLMETGDSQHVLLTLTLMLSLPPPSPLQAAH